ncbi:CoA transferase [Streptomyces sp. NPDC051572]|uniref:CoA transferase n=1 Tax=unclassified Streptomyces TaxID=2593676 RepID=UPI00344D428E
MPTSDTSPADRHAAGLLAMLDAAVPDAAMGSAPHVPAATALADWAASGAMALTGRADGPPLAAPGHAASAVRGALALFTSLTGAHALPDAGLLGERAALMGLTRRGPWSAGGAFRTLRTSDGWVGVSLARQDDRDLVPALVGEIVPDQDYWSALSSWTGGQGADAVAERAQMLGIPAAAVPSAPGTADDEQALHRAALTLHNVTGVPLLATVGGPRRQLRSRPLVIDLTSLWAGPLCASLLGAAGACIVKVESPARPDGARFGPPAFYDVLHTGHASVTLDLASPDGRDTLLRLVEQADLVLEASRPRALRQLGIDAQEIVAAGTTWLSITAYGRTGPWDNRVGFGDDVAAGAGLVVRDRDEVLPCGDALADPLTGVHAAVAAAAALRSERAYLLDVSMRDVTAVASRGPVEPHHVRRLPSRGWQVETAEGVFPVREPYARRAGRPAASQGADTESTLARFVHC